MAIMGDVIPASPAIKAQPLIDSVDNESVLDWAVPVSGDLTPRYYWVHNDRRRLSSVATGAGPWY